MDKIKELTDFYMWMQENDYDHNIRSRVEIKAEMYLNMVNVEQKLPIHNIIGMFSADLNKKLEDYIIEGLKRKGFEFKHKIELEEFVKERCRCEDNIDLKEKIYYVDNIPFFLHNYKSEPLQMPSITDREYKLTANLGTYAYL